MANSSECYLNIYLNDILQKIYASQDLCKLLYYDVSNPLEQADIIDTKILFTDKMNKRIFTTPFNLDIAEIQKTTLTICVYHSEIDNNNVFYKDIMIDFIIVSHVNLWELDTDNEYETNLRPNLIVNELSKLFNREYTVGIGKNHYASLKQYRPNQWYSGYILSYSGMDFVLNN